MSDFEKLITASDLIEWIMETFPDWCVGAVRSIVDHVEALPSAQPEDKCSECDAWNKYKNYGYWSTLPLPERVLSKPTPAASAL